jgi:Ras-related protein Rab-2A
MDFDYIFRFVIIGNSNVGKSCIVSRFALNEFSKAHDITIGVDFATTIINVNGKKIKLNIWDTAGQETFKSITRSYYRNATAIILTYDITNIHSFYDIENWLKDAKTYSSSHPSIILIGNKCDLDFRRAVSKEKAQKYANDNNIFFLESSAKENKNIKEIFTILSSGILKKIDDKEIDIRNSHSGITCAPTKTIVLEESSVYDYAKKYLCCGYA